MNGYVYMTDYLTIRLDVKRHIRKLVIHNSVSLQDVYSLFADAPAGLHYSKISMSEAMVK
jgi:hypothetical protein